MDVLAIDRRRTPTWPWPWPWAVAGLGAAWNAFGIVQLLDVIGQTQESLMMDGMSQAAADLYDALPVWMKVAFALGSVGGLVASILLMLRRTAATPVLAMSLLGYTALFAGLYPRRVRRHRGADGDPDGRGRRRCRAAGHQRAG
jgi:hypothetical protein